LLFGNSHGSAFLSFGLSDPFIGFGLIGLELSADIFTDIHIGNIDGKNFERCSGVQAFI
jgi:hypothetical protein